jgi:hypothetical protein
MEQSQSAERQHLYEWIGEEDDYSDKKFEDQRAEQDKYLASHDIGWWVNWIKMYYNRASLFLNGALDCRMSGDPESIEKAVHLEKMAQQAMAKAAMTAKNGVESSIRVFGDLPEPGLSSGNVEPWEGHEFVGKLSNGSY